MAKKKSERKPKNIMEAVGFQNIFNSEKTDFLLGLIILIIATYIIIAMVSFLNTGQADQSILEDLRPGEWLNTNRTFRNYCGSIGSIIAYTLITVNFGLPAFIIPVFLIIVGLKMMKICTINLWKWFMCLAIVMIWTSVAFAKFLAPFMENYIFNPGGNHGLFCVQTMENVIGAPGLTAVLIFVAIAFLTYLSSETINIVRKILNPVGYLTRKIKFTVINNANHDSSESSETINEDKTNAAIQEESPIKDETPEDVEIHTSTVIDLTEDISDNNSKNKEPEKEKTENSDSELIVEISKTTERPDNNAKIEDDDIIKTPINPKEPFTGYKYPTIDLLKKYDNDGKPFVDMDEIRANNEQIVKVLKSFGVDISEIKATVGPTITLYEITPAPGVRISKIRNLEDDIALSLSALGIRIIAPIPGKGTIGIEVPNRKANIVSMDSIINSKKFIDAKMELPIALGKTISNDVLIVDLAKIPHLLVAGATGQGKSVGLNAIITSLLYKKHPNELKFVLIDPKKVEFSVYSPIADHFMATLPENDEEPIITDVSKVVRTLNSLCTLMEHRYDMLKMAKVRNIKEYNHKFVNHELDLTKGHEFMPYIVVIIDEFGDLIMTAGKEIEMPIARIAQLARAVGIHMVIATQRPTTNIITGTIKANFPGRIAFKVTSMIDSRTILDQPGANQLVGRGDMLILDGRTPNPVRVQCAFVDTPEVKNINEYIESQPGPVEPMELPEPETKADGTSNGSSNNEISNLDPYFEEAANHIVTTQQGSTSMIQRRFSIGYNRAGRLMDQLEKAGIVGAAHGSKPREVLVSDVNQLNVLLRQIKN